MDFRVGSSPISRIKLFLKFGSVIDCRQLNKRECWNWQTGMTKDHVNGFSCGFKSHLPHKKKEDQKVFFFCCVRDEPRSELA